MLNLSTRIGQLGLELGTAPLQFIVGLECRPESLLVVLAEFGGVEVGFVDSLPESLVLVDCRAELLLEGDDGGLHELHLVGLPLHIAVLGVHLGEDVIQPLNLLAEHNGSVLIIAYPPLVVVDLPRQPILLLVVPPQLRLVFSELTLVLGLVVLQFCDLAFEVIDFELCASLVAVLGQFYFLSHLVGLELEVVDLAPGVLHLQGGVAVLLLEVSQLIHLGLHDAVESLHLLREGRDLELVVAHLAGQVVVVLAQLSQFEFGVPLLVGADVVVRAGSRQLLPISVDLLLQVVVLPLQICDPPLELTDVHLVGVKLPFSGSLDLQLVVAQLQFVVPALVGLVLQVFTEPVYLLAHHCQLILVLGDPSQFEHDVLAERLFRRSGRSPFEEVTETFNFLKGSDDPLLVLRQVLPSLLDLLVAVADLQFVLLDDPLLLEFKDLVVGSRNVGSLQFKPLDIVSLAAELMAECLYLLLVVVFQLKVGLGGTGVDEFLHSVAIDFVFLVDVGYPLLVLLVQEGHPPDLTLVLDVRLVELPLVGLHLVVPGPLLLLEGLHLVVLAAQTQVKPVYFLAQQGYLVLVLHELLVELAVLEPVLLDIPLHALPLPEFVLVLLYPASGLLEFLHLLAQDSVEPLNFIAHLLDVVFVGPDQTPAFIESTQAPHAFCHFGFQLHVPGVALCLLAFQLFDVLCLAGVLLLQESVPVGDIADVCRLLPEHQVESVYFLAQQ